MYSLPWKNVLGVRNEAIRKKKNHELRSHKFRMNDQEMAINVKPYLMSFLTR